MTGIPRPAKSIQTNPSFTELRGKLQLGLVSKSEVPFGKALDYSHGRRVMGDDRSAFLDVFGSRRCLSQSQITKKNSQIEQIVNNGGK